ncbi:MAG: hypothetical protein M3506_00880, partial [Chloroflexota bacterium]|nr:hypothetical protein [Chloroflexota bacterium]
RGGDADRGIAINAAEAGDNVDFIILNQFLWLRCQTVDTRPPSNRLRPSKIIIRDTNEVNALVVSKGLDEGKGTVPVIEANDGDADRSITHEENLSFAANWRSS